MNASIKDSAHPSILYYDSDYPSKYHSEFPTNFDAVVAQQGIADDVERYKTLANEYGNDVLELCCGTGRIAIPLAAHGCMVTAVDISTALLKRLKNKINDVPDFPIDRISIVQQDVTRLSLEKKDFDVVVCAFNSLLCIPDFQLQQKALRQAASHLKPGGLLALDIWNPLAMNLLQEEVPESYFSRRRVDNGNVYTRFAATGKMGADQVQPVYGWYDETQPDGTIRRTSYSMEWRIIFRFEIELMLEKAGFKIKNVFGGNHQEKFTTGSQKMFIEAIRNDV
jgi:ubiquinone/menaquinone biosynthesis C-methylase UbiE